MTHHVHKAAVIVAGGSGKRMNAAIPKQFLMLERKPILVHTVERFLAFDQQLIVALVLPASSMNRWEEISREFVSDDYKDRIRLCEGGVARSDSVLKGLERLAQDIISPEECYVAIHDGVRPFVTKEMLGKAFETAIQKGASVSCVPVKSSVREITENGNSKAVDRSRFLHVQTPQTFRLDKITHAHLHKPEGHFTDDASLYEEIMEAVAICEGSYANIKITTPEDIPLAEQLLRKERQLLSSADSHPGKSIRNDIKLLLVDIDGTMTDGSMYYSESGEVMKRFNVKDGMGIHYLVKKYGVEVGFISSGATPQLVKKRAQKLGVFLYYTGSRPKVEVVDEWLQSRSLSYDQLAFIGDDLNDLELMRKVGLAAAPADAAREIQQQAHIILKNQGGSGCVREFIEEVLGYSLAD